jgi:hypothetical protein
MEGQIEMDETAQVNMVQGEEMIKRRLLEYCRGVDRLELELVRNAYHPDAYDDHGPYQGSVDGLIDWITIRHQNIVQSMHLLSNCLIEIRGQRALVETYFTVIQTEKGPREEDPRLQATFYGRYVDIFEERNLDWRILNRCVVVEARTAQVVEVDDASAAWMSSRSFRDRRDVLWEFESQI